MTPPTPATSPAYVGVYWSKRDRVWLAQVRLTRRWSIHLGSYRDPRNAALARDAKVRELGLKRALNFPTT